MFVNNRGVVLYLDAVLEAVKLKENKSVIEHVGLPMGKTHLPAGVGDLATGLAD